MNRWVMPFFIMTLVGTAISVAQLVAGNWDNRIFTLGHYLILVGVVVGIPLSLHLSRQRKIDGTEPGSRP